MIKEDKETGRRWMKGKAKGSKESKDGEKNV